MIDKAEKPEEKKVVQKSADEKKSENAVNVVKSFPAEENEDDVDDLLVVQNIHKIKVSGLEEAEKKVKELMEKVDGNYLCTHCGFNAKFRGNVKIHVLSHFEGIEFQCEFCDKKYATKASLQVHKSVYHK